MLYAGGLRNEERVLVNAVLGRLPGARVSVGAGRGRGRATLRVLVGREGRGQHVGWDEQRPSEALRRV
jgi:hypothetical protein